MGCFPSKKKTTVVETPPSKIPQDLHMTSILVST